MTTFIKAKLNKSDDQTNIDKNRVAANITEDYTIPKLILLGINFPSKINDIAIISFKFACQIV